MTKDTADRGSASRGPGRDIGVLGSEDFTLGFQLAGIRRAIVARGSALAEKADEVLRDPQGIGILVVSAREVESLPPTLRRKLSDSIDPVVVQLGGSTGDLREKVKRAIGVDLYKD
jgi:V/A-type H+-transporting ATPase subunit F